MKPKTPARIISAFWFFRMTVRGPWRALITFAREQAAAKPTVPPNSTAEVIIVTSHIIMVMLARVCQEEQTLHGRHVRT
jgi:hypothetical protein